MRYVFFINPVAGKGKGPQVLTPAIEEYCGNNNLEYKIVITESKGDALNKARLEAETGDDVTLFACGGDGTFLEVLNGAYGYKNVSLGVIPCGSGNDFLKVFSKTELFSDVEEQINGVATPMDIIKAGDLCSMNMCNLGMDAVVADDMTIFKKIPLVSGALAYKLAVVKTFLRKLGVKIKVKIDGEDMGEHNCLFAVCGNGTTYGGGYRSCPNADPSDGLLEWVLVEKISKLKILKILKIYENGEHLSLPIVKSGRCKKLELETETPAPISIDGEIIHKTSISFEVIEKGVNFVLPRAVYEAYMKNKPAAEAVFE